MTPGLRPFSLASFAVFDVNGSPTGETLTVMLDLSVMATPIPEPSSALLYLVSLAVIAPVVTRVRSAGVGYTAMGAGS